MQQNSSDNPTACLFIDVLIMHYAWGFYLVLFFFKVTSQSAKQFECVLKFMQA